MRARLSGPARSSASRTILGAGLVCGVLDISYVLVVYCMFGGASPGRLFQGIAFSLLGRATYEGGASTAGLGLALHFGVALGAAALFYALSRRCRFLVRSPIPGGLLFGGGFYLLMNLAVLPLTRIPFSGFPPPDWTLILPAHFLCVGLPVAFITRRLAP